MGQRMRSAPRIDRYATAPPAEPARRGGPAPIYVVCSPNRQVGKTMLARLLTEHYLTDGRQVAAFDLADEGPGLADFLPDHATIPNIGDMRGQVRFFDGLIEAGNIPKIIDLSHREFANFFTIADKIGLFEEARRRSIEPLILYLIDPSPVSAKAYGLLRRRFVGTSLLPVRNLTVAKGLPYCASFPHASRLVVSLEMAMLGPAARALVERETFSFLNLGLEDSPRFDMPARIRAELDAWFRRARFQFREIELSLIREQILSALQMDLSAGLQSAQRMAV
jgi:hypothetical protein